jgi:hypothetical protein
LDYACSGNSSTTILHVCDLDHQALGCARGDKTRRVLEQTMLWNGQRGRDNEEIPGVSKSVVYTQVGNNHKCLPEGPPEAVPAAPAVQKARWINIRS